MRNDAAFPFPKTGENILHVARGGAQKRPEKQLPKGALGRGAPRWALPGGISGHDNARARRFCFTASEQKRKQKSRGIVPPAFSRLPVRRRRFKKARKKARRGFKKARKRKNQETAGCKRQNPQTQAYQRVQVAKLRQAAAAQNSFGLIVHHSADHLAWIVDQPGKARVKPMLCAAFHN